MERVARIELANNPWQGFRLPLHHTRKFANIKLVGVVGIEPTFAALSRRCLQRYKLCP
jgi:hypothetical protein